MLGVERGDFFVLGFVCRGLRCILCFEFFIRLFQLQDAIRLDRIRRFRFVEASAGGGKGFVLLAFRLFERLHSLHEILELRIQHGLHRFSTTAEFERRTHIQHRVAAPDRAAQGNRRVGVRLEVDAHRRRIPIAVMTIAHREAPFVVRIKRLRMERRKSRRTRSDLV